MNVLSSVTKQANLELKTLPKQLMGYLPLDLTLTERVVLYISFSIIAIKNVYTGIRITGKRRAYPHKE
jgi:hypothetical protein